MVRCPERINKTFFQIYHFYYPKILWARKHTIFSPNVDEGYALLEAIFALLVAALLVDV